MTVTELILNFHAALAAASEAADRAGVPWREPHAYDEWDTVATALYASLVVQPLRWSLPKARWEQFTCQPYDLDMADASSVSYVQVHHDQFGGVGRPFRRLTSRESRFDSVAFHRASDSEARPIVPLAECEFELVLAANVGGGVLRQLTRVDA